MKATAIPLQVLCQLADESKQRKYPNTPASFIPKAKYSDRTANGLTRCIIDFLQLSGHQAERISNTGRVIDSRKKVKDCLGRQREIGSVTWVKGTDTNGTADISATIKGRSVKIEVKVGRDVQSNEQKAYQHAVEAAGGVYVLASSFTQVYEWYLTFLQ